MRSGLKEDWESTKEQLRNPCPIRESETWLGHKGFSQAALIDPMLLKGQSSIEEIATAWWWNWMKVLALSVSPVDVNPGEGPCQFDRKGRSSWGANSYSKTLTLRVNSGSSRLN